jgi:hypothetical protein
VTPLAFASAWPSLNEPTHSMALKTGDARIICLSETSILISTVDLLGVELELEESQLL